MNIFFEQNLKRIIHRIPFKVLKPLFSSYHVIPVYHVVSNDAPAHIKHLYKIKTINEFNKELDFLAKNYNIVGINDLYKASKINKLHLTFDDGYRECYDIIMPILLKKGIPATFFINTDFIDNQNMMNRCKISLIYDEMLKLKNQSKLSEIKNYAHSYPSIKDWVLSFEAMNDKMIKKLCHYLEIDIEAYLKNIKPYLSHHQIKALVKQGFTIGSHGKKHINFKHLSLEEQANETIETCNFISKKYNQDLKLFAFPYEDLDVSRSFFQFIQSKVDFTFGTTGFYEDKVKNNYQRIWMESYENGNIKDYYSIKYREKIFRKYVLKKDFIQRT